LGPFLAEAKFDDATRALYAGTLRILLVLIHDFPDFLAAYHHSLCDAIPPNCIQLSNIILSAYPLNVRVFDPFAADLSLDQTVEGHALPLILSDFKTVLQAADLATSLNKAITHRSAQAVVPVLKERMAAPSLKSKTMVVASTYNLPLVSAVVLWLGYAGTHDLKENAPIYTPNSTPALIFKQLVAELDPEGAFPILLSFCSSCC